MPAVALVRDRATVALKWDFGAACRWRPRTGPRVQIEGAASFARMLAVETSGGRTNPPENSRPRRDSPLADSYRLPSSVEAQVTGVIEMRFVA